MFQISNAARSIRSFSDGLAQAFCLGFMSVLVFAMPVSAQTARSKTHVCLPQALINGETLCLGQSVDSLAQKFLFQGPLQYNDYVKAYGGKLQSSPFLGINLGVTDSTAKVITRMLLMRDPELLADSTNAAFDNVITQCRKAFGEDYRIVDNTRKSRTDPIEPIFTWDKKDYAAAVYVSVITDSLDFNAPPRLVPLWFSIESQPAGNRYPDRPDSKVWTRAVLGLPVNAPENAPEK